MFSTARLRLTLWYLAVLAAIVLLLSLALYDVLLRLQQAEAQAIGRAVRYGGHRALLRERTPAEYQEILRTAAVEAECMGILICDLLALARAQSDRETLVLEPLDLREVTHEAAEGVRPLAERKGQTLEVVLDGALPAEGDRCPARTIRLTARQDHGRAIIAVRDTGPGIAAQHLPHLVEPFYRVDATRGGGSGHSGLGLALAAWLIRAHGGRLSVESCVGARTVFTLSLPLASRPRTVPMTRGLSSHRHRSSARHEPFHAAGAGSHTRRQHHRQLGATAEVDARPETAQGQEDHAGDHDQGGDHQVGVAIFEQVEHAQVPL